MLLERRQHDQRATTGERRPTSRLHSYDANDDVDQVIFERPAQARSEAATRKGPFSAMCGESNERAGAGCAKWSDCCKLTWRATACKFTTALRT
jgi:hypothetical protein